MARDDSDPAAEKDPQDFQRWHGLYVSEWVTYSMIIIVIAATIYGVRVSGERDAQAERAMTTLDTLAEEAERVFVRGGALSCDDTLLDDEQLANDYLTLSVRPAPIDEDDESLGYGPSLYVDVVEEEVSGDTWDTAQRLMALVKERDREEAEDAEEAGAAGAAEDAPRRPVADAAAEDGEAAEEEDEEEDGRLRKVRKSGFDDDEEFLRYYILASETAICSRDA